MQTPALMGSKRGFCQDSQQAVIAQHSEDSLFVSALDKYFDGNPDQKTIELLKLQDIREG
jgi:uncharacterized protein (DUF1810 family)